MHNIDHDNLLNLHKGELYLLVAPNVYLQEVTFLNSKTYSTLSDCIFQLNPLNTSWYLFKPLIFINQIRFQKLPYVSTCLLDKHIVYFRTKFLCDNFKAYKDFSESEKSLYLNFK